MAGSGKTSLMQRINAYIHEKEIASYFINLDPGNDKREKEKERKTEREKYDEIGQRERKDREREEVRKSESTNKRVCSLSLC